MVRPTTITITNILHILHTEMKSIYTQKRNWRYDKIESIYIVWYAYTVCIVFYSTVRQRSVIKLVSR